MNNIIINKVTETVKWLLPLYFFAFLPLCISAEQNVDYKIIYERDTVIKTRAGGFSLATRAVRRFIYEYTSKDVDGKPVTISGVMMIPSNIIEGTPCDGIMLFNRATLGSPEDCPSTGESELINGLIANPLSPNYILVMSDFIGYGSSSQYPMFYHSGDVNARNSLDGLLAARQILTDKQLPQGKYLFNLGFSQGGSEALYVAKLRDMEYKDRGVTFTKTFAGGGPTDYVVAYREYVSHDWCEDCKDVIMMMISCVENCHMNIDYKDLFKEPLASGVQEFIKTKKKSTLSDFGVSMRDSLHNLIQPAYMDPETPQAKAFMAELEKINLMNGWEPDLTQRYFIEHSRHDNFVPIQCVRAIIPWMKEKGFSPSIVPGKSNLQTNTIVFKLDHTGSAIVWLIQTVAAIQFWPVLYYEGEQNRYFHDVVGDMNLMKVIKTLESWGIDLQKIAKENGLSLGNLFARVSDTRRMPKKGTIFDLIPDINKTLSAVDLTTDNLDEMCKDSGITDKDILEAFGYIIGLKTSRAQEAEQNIEAPLYLLRSYERQLAEFFLLGGYDVSYGNWGN
jgi:hypothetical protein